MRMKSFVLRNISSPHLKVVRALRARLAAGHVCNRSTNRPFKRQISPFFTF